jgi:hypothetical protein
MTNPNDAIRDVILRHLYSVHKKARSPRTAGLTITELSKALKAQGIKLQDVASNLDYLVQKGWAREVIEQRRFVTPGGTERNSEKRSYKISDSGIDRLEAASTFKRSTVGSSINVTNIRGVTVVGEGNVVNTTFTDLSRTLNELKQAILQESQIPDTDKLNIVADIDALEAQLQKPEPSKSVIRTLWDNVQKIAATGSIIELVHKAAALIQPLLQ